MMFSKEGRELIRSECFRRGRLFALTAAAMVAGVAYYFANYKWANFGPGNEVNLYATVFFAVINAVSGFSWLFSVKRSAFYFALPVKRRTLFAVNYLLGILQFILPFLLYAGACGLVLNAGGGVGGERIWQNFVWANVVALIGYLMFYHLTLAAILLAGTPVTASVVFLTMLCFWDRMISGVIKPYCNIFYEHYFKIPIWDHIRGFFSPFLLFTNMANMNSSNGALDGKFEPRTEYLTAGAVLVLVMLAAVCLLYRIRKSETAGNPFFHKKAEPVLRVLILIPASLLAGQFFLFCFKGNLFAGIVGAAAGGGFTWLFLHLLFYGSMHRLRRNRSGVLCALLLSVGVILLFAGSKNGYDLRVPKGEKTAEMAVFLEGVDDPYREESSADGRNRVIERSLANRMMSVEGKDLAVSYIDSLDKGKNGQEAVSTLYVLWKDGAGSPVYRKYPVTEKEAEAFDSLYTNGEYKDVLYPPADAGEADLNNRTFIWSNGVEEYMLALDREEKERLTKVYQSELKTLSLEMVSKSRPCGTLRVQNEITRLSSVSYLYKEFTETAAFLRERGIPVDQTIADYEITRVIKNACDETGYITSRQILDADTIAALKENLFVCDYYIHPLLHPIENMSVYEIYVRDDQMQTADRIKAYLSE